MKKINLCGLRFGRLIVLEEAEKSDGKRKDILWHCRCDCGKELIVRGSNLRDGRSTSCGCYKIERTREVKSTHGDSKTRLYRIWACMITRVTNKNRKSWRDYGGRGIEVCTEWQTDFATFRDWAHANGYRDNLSIDRINNDGNYEPNNCRWATVKEQNLNQRGHISRFSNGERMNFAKLAREHGLRPDTLWWRLKQGWSLTQALNTKVGECKHDT